ncbi:c-type cytochrome biogenesis protein CcmI [Benzoatithermus flavus]|uniref:C-type cytochrome biogenesis protein CcmI n=1 Tax=Benzoatithermus flavus TaxID=3108223 RepID=A0ABU8XVL1_9PROT
MNSLFLVFAVLTVIAVGAVLWPVFRRQHTPQRARFELDVYRDQLAEIDRDLERGLIAPAEAKAARLEVERRLLRAAGSLDPEAKQPAAAGRHGPVLAAALAVPLLAAGLYGILGSPDLPDQPIASRQDRQQDPGRPDIRQMVAGLEARLQQNPGDVEGWLMLGRSKGVLGRPQEAVEAYRRAVALKPDDPRAQGGLAEALVTAAQGIVTPEAKGLFQRVAERDPADPRPDFYLGWADAQAGDYHMALERWRKLLAATPADAPWRPRVVDAIREAAGELELDPEAVLAQIPTPPATAAQPSQEDVAKIQAMSPEKRETFIRSMVEKLQARMDADGSDVEGWLRLAQARLVLGDAERAKATFEKALSLHPDVPVLLKGYAATLLGPVRPETGLPEIGDKAAELYSKAASLEPGDPEAWWYLGIRALQEGRKDEARANWQKVLAKLDPSRPEYAEVKSRLDQLGG